MKDKTKIFIYLLLAVVAYLIVRYSYLWVKRQFAGLQTNALESTDSVNPKVINADYSAGNSFPLKQGSIGSNVVKLQQFLNAYAGASLSIDGKFGPKTKAALAAYSGKVSVSQDDLTKWINTKVKNTDNSGDWGSSSGGNGASDSPDYFSDSAQYPTDMQSFAVEVKTDLDSVYILKARDNSGVWAQALALSPTDLKALANVMQNTYGENLYNRINSVRWSISDNVDILLKNKLIACGAGPA